MRSAGNRKFGKTLAALVSVLAAIPLLLALIGLGSSPELRVKPGYEREFLEIEGGRLGYYQTGSGPDVVLLHGAIGSVEDWTPLMQALAASHRLTVLDRPGFFQSEPASARDLTLAGNADIAAAAIRVLKLDRPLLVGHSHGGSIALVFAVRHPDLIQALVTLDTSGPAAYRPGWNDRLLALPLVGRGLAVVVGGLVGPDMIRRSLEKALAPRLTDMPQGFLPFRMKLWSHPNHLTAFAHQNLVAPREFDQYAGDFQEGRRKLPLAMAYCEREAEPAAVAIRRAFAQKLNPDRLLRLEDCSHYVQYTNAAEIAALIRSL